MVRRNIQDRAHVGFKIRDGLQLKAADLRDRIRLVCRAERGGRIRCSDISYYKHLFIVRAHDLPDQRGRRRLSVCPRYGCQLSPGIMVCKLDLTPNRDLAGLQHLDKRGIKRDTRTDNAELHVL